MKSRSTHGGRHELGQNFLHHRPTIERILTLVSRTEGAILEIGAGDGALTVPLSALGRDLLAVEIDEHRVHRLSSSLRRVTVRRADALDVRLDRPVIVSNVPFHITTPVLRRLLSSGNWRDAVLLTQWEVARKRAGVGGRTMMTAQTGPWFTFSLEGRVPAHGFRPRPSVDGGLLTIHRRATPLLPLSERRGYVRFVQAVFTGRGNGLKQVLANAVPGLSTRAAAALLADAGVTNSALPRDLTSTQWTAMWTRLQAGHRQPARAR